MTKLKAFLSWLKEWQTLVSAAIFFLTLFLGVSEYIDSRIKKTVTDREFLSNIAKRIQPSLIIDQNQRLEADLGGSDYIDPEEIDFVVNTNIDTTYSLSITSYSFDEMPQGNSTDYPMPNQIIIKAKKHLAYAPIITPLPPFNFAYTAHRGKGYRWIYDISYITGYPRKESPPLRIKIDIIK